MPGTELETRDTKAVKVQSCPPRACPLVSQVDTEILKACGKCNEGERHRVPLKHRRSVPDQCVVWVPGTTLSFSDLLEGLKELRNTVILTITLYCSERIQIKIGRGKRYKRWNPRKARHQLPGVFPRGVLRTVLNPSESEAGHHGQCIADQGSSAKPWYPGLLLGVSPVGMECFKHLTRLSYSRVRQIQHKPGLPQNHIVSVNYAGWPRAPGGRRLLSGRISQGLRAYLSGSIKSQAFLWNV